MIVRQWMSSKFVLLPIETSLPDALRFLNSKGINLVGVLNESQIESLLLYIKSLK